MALAVFLLFFVYTLLSRSSSDFDRGKKYNDELEQMQRMAIRLRRDLYKIKPINIPIDLVNGLSGKDPRKRVYHQSVLVNRAGGQEVMQLDPTIVETSQSVNNITGRSVQNMQVSSANFYEEIPVYGTADLLFLQNALVTYRDVEIKEEQFTGIIDEYYINTQEEQVRWRYYKIEFHNGDPSKFSAPRYVTREALDKVTGAIISTEIFGVIPRDSEVAPGRLQSSIIITRFDLITNYWTRCIFYKDGAEWHGFSAMVTQVNLGTTAQDRDFFDIYRIRENMKLFYTGANAPRDQWPGQTILNFVVNDPKIAGYLKAKGYNEHRYDEAFQRY